MLKSEPHRGSSTADSPRVLLLLTLPPRPLWLLPPNGDNILLVAFAAMVLMRRTAERAPELPPAMGPEVLLLLVVLSTTGGPARSTVGWPCCIACCACSIAVSASMPRSSWLLVRCCLRWNSSCASICWERRVLADLSWPAFLQTTVWAVTHNQGTGERPGQCLAPNCADTVSMASMWPGFRRPDCDVKFLRIDKPAPNQILAVFVP